MNQSNLTHLVSRLAVKVRPRHRKLKNVEGPYGRLKFIRKIVTSLFKNERLEVIHFRADEARPYAERLISEAIRYGDRHKPTMDLADFWLEDKALVPKLFKVLVPRYENWPSGLPYTRMLRAPSSIDPKWDRYELANSIAVLELRGNPYPPLPGPVNTSANPNLIHNILLEEARKDYFKSQTKQERQVEEEISVVDSAVSTENTVS